MDIVFVVVCCILALSHVEGAVDENCVVPCWVENMLLERYADGPGGRICFFYPKAASRHCNTGPRGNSTSVFEVELLSDDSAGVRYYPRAALKQNSYVCVTYNEKLFGFLRASQDGGTLDIRAGCRLSFAETRYGVRKVKRFFISRQTTFQPPKFINFGSKNVFETDKKMYVVLHPDTIEMFILPVRKDNRYYDEKKSKDTFLLMKMAISPYGRSLAPMEYRLKRRTDSYFLEPSSVPESDRNSTKANDTFWPGISDPNWEKPFSYKNLPFFDIDYKTWNFGYRFEMSRSEMAERGACKVKAVIVDELGDWDSKEFTVCSPTYLRTPPTGEFIRIRRVERIPKDCFGEGKPVNKFAQDERKHQLRVCLQHNTAHPCWGKKYMIRFEFPKMNGKPTSGYMPGSNRTFDCYEMEGHVLGNRDVAGDPGILVKATPFCFSEAESSDAYVIREYPTAKKRIRIKHLVDFKSYNITLDKKLGKYVTNFHISVRPKMRFPSGVILYAKKSHELKYSYEGITRLAGPPRTNAAKLSPEKYYKYAINPGAMSTGPRKCLLQYTVVDELGDLDSCYTWRCEGAGQM